MARITSRARPCSAVTRATAWPMPRWSCSTTCGIACDRRPRRARRQRARRPRRGERAVLRRGDEATRERGLLAGGRVAMDDTLRDGLVEGPDGVEDGRALLGALGAARRLHETTDLRTDGTVAQSAV